MLRLCLALLCGMLPLAAQLDPNTITVTASRTLTGTVNQAVLQITVNAPQDATLEQISAVLQQAGLGSLTFTGAGTRFGVSNPLFGNALTLRWTFRATVALAALPQAVASTLALKQPGWPLSVDISSITNSDTPPCPYAALIADARAQAQKLAALAGLSVGNILGLSDTPRGDFASLGIPTPIAAFRLGDFVSTAAFATFTLPSPPSTCSLGVKFALLR